jgi:hypothetical protein
MTKVLYSRFGDFVFPTAHSGVGCWSDCWRPFPPTNIRTTLNIYGDVVTDEMAQANSKVAGLAVNGSQTL